MGYHKKERPRVKAEIASMFVTGVLRDHPKSFFLRNFMEYYLDSTLQENVVFKKKIKSFNFAPETEQMILARVFKEMEDKAVSKSLFEVATKMIAQGLDWKMIRKTTGLTKSKYLQLEKTFKVSA